jgi:hypothetical protein
MSTSKETPVVIMVDEYQEMSEMKDDAKLSRAEQERREEVIRIMHEIFLLGRANAIKFPIA